MTEWPLSRLSPGVKKNKSIHATFRLIAPSVYIYTGREEGERDNFAVSNFMLKIK
jgi:hypothetical protein